MVARELAVAACGGREALQRRGGLAQWPDEEEHPRRERRWREPLLEQAVQKQCRQVGRQEDADPHREERGDQHGDGQPGGDMCRIAGQETSDAREGGDRHGGKEDHRRDIRAGDTVAPDDGDEYEAASRHCPWRTNPTHHVRDQRERVSTLVCLTDREGHERHERQPRNGPAREQAELLHIIDQFTVRLPAEHCELQGHQE